MTETPKLDDVGLVDVHDALQDIASGLTAIASAAQSLGEQKPQPINVAAPIIPPQPPAQVTVPTQIDVHVPPRKAESYLVHDIERDESKLITSFRITVEHEA